MRYPDPDPKLRIKGPGKARQHRPEQEQESQKSEYERPEKSEPSGENRREVTNVDEQKRITNAGSSAAMEEREIEGV